MTRDEQLSFILRMRDQASEGLRRFNKNVRQTGQTARKQTSQLNEMAAVAGRAAIAVGGIYTAQAAGRAAIRNYAKFEEQLVEIQKVTELTKEEVAAFGDAITEAGKGVPATRSELGALAASAGRLGVEGRDNMLAFARTMSKLRTTTDVAGDEAATSIARVLNVLEESPSTVSNFSSALVSLGNNVAGTESEILGITEELARNSTQFNVTSTALQGLAATLVETGARAENAGSTLQRVLSKMNTGLKQGSQEGERFAEVMGLSVRKAAQLFEDSPIEAFRRFVSGLKDAKDNGEALSTVLEGMSLQQLEVRRVLGPLSSRIDLLSGNIDRATKAARENKALNEEWHTATQSLSSQWRTFTGDLNDFLGALFEESGLISAMRQAIKVTTDFINSLDVEQLTEFNKELQAIALTVGVLTARAGIALLITMIGKLRVAIRTLTVTLSSNPFTLLATVLAVSLGPKIIETIRRMQGLETQTKDTKDEINKLRPDIDKLTSSQSKLAKQVGLSTEALKNQGRELSNVVEAQVMSQIMSLRTSLLEIERLGGFESQSERVLKLKESAEKTMQSLRGIAKNLRSDSETAEGLQESLDRLVNKGLLPAKKAQIEFQESSDAARKAKEGQNRQIDYMLSHLPKVTEQWILFGGAVSDADDQMDQGHAPTEERMERLKSLRTSLRKTREAYQDFIDKIKGESSNLQRSARQDALVQKVVADQGPEAAEDLKARLAILNEAQDRGIALSEAWGRAWLDNKLKALKASEAVSEAEKRNREADQAALESTRRQSRLEQSRKALSQERQVAEVMRSKGVAAAEALRRRYEVINQLRQRGFDLTSDTGRAALRTRMTLLRQQEETRKLAEGMSKVGDETESNEDAMKRWLGITKGAVDEAGRQIQRGLSSAFTDLFKGEIQSVRDFFSRFVSIAFKAFAQIAASSLVKNVLGTLAGGSAGGGSPITSLLGFAKGGVVDQPTFFQYGGRQKKAGVMGEAGAEAIMPLTRGRDGNLGVRMTGGSGQNAVYNINVTVQGDKSDDPEDTGRRVGDAVRRQFDKRMTTVLKEQTRPGNFLNPVTEAV